MKLTLAFLWLLHWLPLPLLGRIGKAFGTLLFHLLKKRRHITLTNLRLCLPDLTESEHQAIAKQHFQAYARSVLERAILWWAPKRRLKKLIQIEPHLPLEEFRAGPVIVLCPHFVCLDIAGVAISMEMSASSIYMRQRNEVFDEALRRGRERFHPIQLYTRQQGIKPILRALKGGLPFFMLPDMDFGRKDSEFVPFFGTLAATLTAPARLAAASGAKIIPVIATFLPNYRGWRVKFYPPWEDFPGNDMVAATARMNAFIEARILEAPSEYFWTHRRFKTRPKGEQDIYNS